MDNHTPENTVTHTPRNRGSLIAAASLSLARTSWSFLAIAAATWLIGQVIGALWTIALPSLLALIASTVLWPPTRYLRRKGIPSAISAVLVLAGFVTLAVSIVALIVPIVVKQIPPLVESATSGLRQIQDWLAEPPFNLDAQEVQAAMDAVIIRIQNSGDAIASGILSGVGTAGSYAVTAVITFFLTFFFIKDGTRFLPWIARVSGPTAGGHLANILTGIWTAVGSFIRTQAAVSFIDAVFIGAGLLLLEVPLALVLATLTFIGGFIPIAGAVVAGTLAVLVALVANGLTTALIVLALILVVQQIEGSVLQPILQSRALRLHPAVVLAAVTVGGSLFGISGAFLAIPFTASIAVVLRYVSQEIDLRSHSKLANQGTKESAFSLKS